MKTLDLFNEVYDEYTHRVYEIYEIFKDQFGEDNVDLQNVIPKPEAIPQSVLDGCNLFESEQAKKDLLKEYFRGNFYGICNIYVHWSHVRVTNEFDKYTDLNDLWAKVSIYYSGKLVECFKLNRSNYSYLHISSGYMHSHISSIPFYDFTQFQKPCTGIGPINGTISSLQRNYDSDLWKLFCCELNNYVTVESVAGVPYHRLETLGRSYRSTRYEHYHAISNVPSALKRRPFEHNYKEFIKEVILAKKLKFAYVNGAYRLGMSLAECAMIMSNIFISWVNSKRIPVTLNELTASWILTKCIYQGGIVHECTTTSRDFSSYVGKKVLTFKGNDVLLTIDGLQNVEVQPSLILDSTVVNFIVTVILQVINYRYGRKRTTKKSEFTTNSSEIYI